MNLSPIIVAICLNAGPTYNEACKTALEQGAAQSGIAGRFEHVTKQAEQDVIRYLNPSQKLEISAAVVGYSYQLMSGRQATFALPNPGIKNSSMSISIGKDATTLGLTIGF